jgi:hypothetical protein
MYKERTASVGIYRQRLCGHTVNDCANMPAIYQPTDRQALCLTTITTAAGTVLLPK